MVNELLPWHIFQGSVRGATHRRNGQPKQDAVRIFALSQLQAWLIALADGHGGTKNFRSQYGARIAVAVAHKILSQGCELDGSTRINRWASERLPLEITRCWRERITRFHNSRAFTSEEWESLTAEERTRVQDNFYLAYGSTLLTVVVTPGFILYLQLGDGDILTLETTGVISRPFQRDAQLIANETTSLCSPTAEYDVKVRVQTLAGAPPQLILLATDGYANAFRDEAGFIQVVRDFWTILQEDNGAATIRASLNNWLDQASEQGSGDDISLGVIWRPAITNINF